MQTEKFTLLEYDKLLAINNDYYQKIIQWAATNKKPYIVRKLKTHYNNKAFLNLNKLDTNFYIRRALELIQQTNNTTRGYISLKTSNEKMLFITNFVFPDNQKFIETLEYYGIDKDACINFSEAIKQWNHLDKQSATAKLNLLMQEFFPNLNQVKTHYGTNNTGVIINKILEIAYLHPELLHTKEKS